MDLQLVTAVAAPLAAVLVAWLNYRSVAVAERWRTRRLLVRVRAKLAARGDLAAADDEATETSD